MSIRIQPEPRYRRLAAVVAAWVLCCPLLSHATQAGSLSGAATLIRPDLSSLSVTNTQIKNLSETNIDLVAVGQIPVLATNIDYQIIFTNGGPITILYDTLILTNSPIVTGGPYVCTDLMITNVTIGETNIVKVGTTCVLTNNLRIVSIATNDISASLQYYILATTNLIFDAADPRCWQTVYQTNLTISTSVSTNTTVIDYNFTFAGSDTARGSVELSQKGNQQSFSVLGRDLLTGEPPLAMGVFIGDSIFNVNWRQVGIMAKAGTNNLYRLELTSETGAPPTLGVANVADLAGLLVQIRDQDTNVYAQAVIPELTPSPSALSYSRTVKMQRPSPAPSPRATGKIRVKFNGQTGASYLEVSVKKLAAGNSYCALYTPNPNPNTSGCDEGLPLVNGRGFDRFDTNKGQALPFGIGTQVSTVEDLAGLHVFIIDAFGDIHLSGIIPGP